jgi:hypothetical protein
VRRDLDDFLMRAVIRPACSANPTPIMTTRMMPTGPKENHCRVRNFVSDPLHAIKHVLEKRLWSLGLDEGNDPPLLTITRSLPSSLAAGNCADPERLLKFANVRPLSMVVGQHLCDAPASAACLTSSGCAVTRRTTSTFQGNADRVAGKLTSNFVEAAEFRPRHTAPCSSREASIRQEHEIMYRRAGSGKRDRSRQLTMPIGEKHEAISAIEGRGVRSSVNQPSAVSELDGSCRGRRFRSGHQRNRGK